MPAKLVLVNGKKLCTKCKEWKFLDDFVSAVNTTTKKAGSCKLCINSERKIKYHTDKDFKDRFKSQVRKSKLKLKYGLSVIDYETLLEEQENRCKICTKEFNNDEPNTSARIDHDHATGKIRGLLCNNCNLGLGLYFDNKEYLMNAIIYLEENEV